MATRLKEVDELSKVLPGKVIPVRIPCDFLEQSLISPTDKKRGRFVQR